MDHSGIELKEKESHRNNSFLFKKSLIAADDSDYEKERSHKISEKKSKHFSKPKVRRISVLLK